MEAGQEIPAVSRWQDPESEEAFQMIAEGLCDLAGFGVTLVYVRRGDRLAIVSIAGAERLMTTDGAWWTAEEALSEDAPLDLFLDHLSLGENWGMFTFIPHDRLDPGPEVDVAWVPNIEVSDDPDAWHPNNMLIAPIFDDNGVLWGALGVDDPISGRLPDPTQRRIMERFARQARRAILIALEREQFAERVELADTARRVIRSAAGQATIAGVLDRVGDEVIRCFGLVGIRARVLDPSTRRLEYADAGLTPPRTEQVDSQAALAARVLWDEGRTGIIAVDDDSPGVFGEDLTTYRTYLKQNDLSSVAIVPIGIGDDCMGSLSLFREPDAPEWTPMEIGAVYDLGRDLTASLATQITLQRERATIDELHQLDEYKDRLIATVSHELKTPLTAIVGQTELMLDEELEPGLERSLGVVERSAKRMTRVINDLLMLAKDANRSPGHDLVDLAQVVDDALDLLEQTARARSITISVTHHKGPVTVVADRSEIDRMVLNLASNAIKYSPEGSAVQVETLQTPRGAQLRVIDHGIGISTFDQERLFTEFFRSNDPFVRAQPGTGLGLAIVDRIARRYGGSVDVESTLHEGSTFSVTLPSLDD